MNRRLLSTLFFIALVGTFAFEWGCGTPSECRYDSDCPGDQDLCTGGKCTNNSNKDGGTQRDTTIGLPPECQNGSTRSCYTAAAETQDVGLCRGGKQTCAGGKWEECKDEVLPAAKEECNEKDDDCDGLIDEGCDCKDGETRSCYNGPAGTQNNPPCSSGTQECSNGKWGESCAGQNGPQKDECDGIDNDCNGQIDDDCPCKSGETKDCYTGPPATVGQGNCKKGTMTCKADGKWGTCEGATAPGKETCNGDDDDCDGQIDNGCACTPGKTQECYAGPDGTAGKGLCKKGTQTCDPQGVWGPCQDEIKPVSEACNGKDDDCNGQIDDKLQAPTCPKQEGVCAGSTKECKGEQGWIDCDNSRYTANAKTFEQDETLCDNLDNDCDGKTDEDLKRSCYSAQKGCTKEADGTYKCDGACKAGTQLCQAGRWTDCKDEVQPQKEICDGKDDDCDGKIDNGCACRPNETRPCYGGPAGTEGKGECKGGNQSCLADGSWGPCAGEVQPATETCNGKDTDCNGQIDDGLTGPPCTRKSGVCAGLRQTCSGTGGWVDCTEADYKKNSTLYEVTEISCDGKDNDCDGNIDQNLTRPCYGGTAGCTKQANGSYSCQGECKAGTQACRNGQWDTCTGATEPIAENCTNGKDDNCNGQVDDCGVCTAGQTRPCYTGTSGCTKQANGSYSCQGACKTGTQTCQANRQWSTTCTGELSPTPESCNWLDDDCNGKIDENGACIYSKWSPRSTPSGATKAAFFDEKNGIAIGTSGRVWRTSNGGTSWTSVTSGTTSTLQDLAVHPNGLAIIVGSSGTILQSTNSGEVFKKIASPVTNTLYGVTISNYSTTTGYQVLAVGTSGTLLGSQNGGATFTRLTSGTTQTLYAVRYRPNSGYVMFVGSSGTIRLSTNYGTSWTTVTSGVTNSLYELAWSGAYVIVTGSSGTVLRSTNSGSTFTKLTFSDNVPLRMAASSGRDFFVIGSSSKYYISTDNGATFEGRGYGVASSYTSFSLLSPTALFAISSSGNSAVGEGPARLISSRTTSTIYSIAYDNQYGSGTALAVGSSGVLYRSTNSGTSWSRVYLPTTSTLYGVSFIDQYAVVVGSSGTIYRSADKGATWSKSTSGTTSTLYSVAIAKQSSRYVAIAVGSLGSIYRSLDAGVTWSKITSGTTSTLYSVTYKNPTVVVVGSSGSIYRSTNDGTSFTKITSGVTSTLRGVYIYSSTGNGLTVGSGGTILRTTNGGSSWTRVTSNTTNYLYGVGMDYGNAVAVGSSGTLLLSTNSGSTWTAQTGQPNVSYYSTYRMYASNNYIASGSSGTILLSSTRGTNWAAQEGPAISLQAVSSTGVSQYVASGSSVFMRTLNNGTTWSYPTMPNPTTYYGLTTDDTTGYMLAVGLSGRMLRSTDRGATWTTVTTTNTRSMYAAASPASRTFVAVGLTGTILQSTNGGTSFTTRTSGTTSQLRGIDCSGDLCIAVGSSSAIVRSTFRGSNWTTVPAPKTTTLYGIAFGSKTNAVIVGSSGTVFYSTDGGLKWTEGSSGTAGTLYAVDALDANRFVATDSYGRVIASGDGGKTWTFHSPTVNQSLNGISLRGNLGAIIGNAATVLLYTRP